MVTGNAELQSIKEDQGKETAVAENGVQSFGGFDNGVQSFGGFEDCMMEDDEDRDEKINFSLVEEEEECKDMVCSPAGDFSFEDRSGSFEKPAEDGNFLRESEVM